MGHWFDPHLVYPLNYFSFQPLLHNWCNKGNDMCYPVSRIMPIKDPLLLIRKRSVHKVVEVGFLSHYVFCHNHMSITIYRNVLTASLNKPFPSFLFLFCSSICCLRSLSDALYMFVVCGHCLMYYTCLLFKIIV